MHITTFAMKVAEKEGLKEPQNIAQINETLRVVDDLLAGVLYAIIRLLPEPRKNAKG